jgi:hypothetical protein
MRIRISRSILWIIRLVRMVGRVLKGGGSCVYWEACIVQMGWELGTGFTLASAMIVEA